VKKYDSPHTCNKCGKQTNEIKVTDSLNGYMHECKTTCTNCGFKDYWAHGFFESGQEMQGEARKVRGGQW